MNIVGARLGLDCNHAAQSFTELGVIILQVDLCFLDGVEIRIHDDNSKNRILIVGAVQLERCAAEMLAVHEYLLAALRVFGRSVAPSHHFLRTRRKEFERCEVPVHHRQVFHIFFVELNRHVGAVGLELRSFGRNLHLFTRGTNLEMTVYRYAGVSRNLDVFELENLESSCLNSNRINVGDKMRYRVVAALVGSGCFRGVLGLADDRHFCTVNGGAGRIGDGADDAAEDCLPESSLCPKAGKNE